ncbi:peptidoglycan bridge formation glycyltransferase FemA/FemB family protein [Patescibacteria group bacterium]|nr:peptidoglycan bridge formation glycyltransferase FemA/FemB family protein [Patescibacteria group bacterium]
MIQIREIVDKSTWEKFNLASRNPSFLQSWAWGEFQKKLGRDVYRLGVFKDSNLAGISLVYKEKAKIGSFFYCPGSVFTEWRDEYIKPWLDYVGSLAKEKNVVFLRIDPRIYQESAKKLLRKQGFTPAFGFTQPQCTATIDLTQTEEELRREMSASTRHNVNAAERKGVRVRQGGGEDISVFLKLLKETAKRKTLTLPLEVDYHKKQFKTLEKEGLMKLFVAEANKQVLSAALLINYADTSYYLHAANSLQKKNLRASYPLVWYTVLESKAAGVKKFDFWGIAATEEPKDPWLGVTNFKLSFGAKKECYEPPLDLPYKSNYQLMKVVEIWRKPVRKILRFGR